VAAKDAPGDCLDHAITRSQVSSGRSRCCEGAANLFTRGKKSNAKREVQPRSGADSSRSVGSRWKTGCLKKSLAAVMR